MAAPNFVDTVGAGKITTFASNPIVGDPEPCIRLASDGWLTTGDLAAGDAGEVGGLFAGFSVELWHNPGSIPAASADYLVRGPNTSTGRQWEITIGTNGAYSFTTRNAAGAATTATGPPVAVGGWYHIIATVALGGVINLYVNGSLVANNATWGGPFNNVLAAGSSDLRIGDAGNEMTGSFFTDLAVYRSTLSAARVTAHYQAGTARGFNPELPGARINKVLDLSYSSARPRSIGAGVRTVDADYMTGQAPLDQIREAVSCDAVDAAYFVSAGGVLTFLAAGHRSSAPYNTTQATYGDGGGSELPYLDLKKDFSESFLFNEWSVTRLGTERVAGITQVVRDTTSINKRFKRTQQISGTPLTLDSDALAIATAMLAKYKDPFERITGIEPNMADPETALQTFRLDLLARIRALQTPPGAGARFDQTIYVQKIETSWAPGRPPAVKLAVSPL